MFAELFVSSNAHYFTPASVPRWPNQAVVIDVGACEGLFSVRAVKEFGARRVVAVEPGAAMAELLVKTFETNSVLDRTEVINCLAGRVKGEANFCECLEDPTLACVAPAGSTMGERVRILPLDEIAQELQLDRVDVIKVDAEGADLEILQGAEQIIRKWKPTLLMTTYHVATHAREMREWLTSMGLGYQFVVQGLTTMGTAQVRPVCLFAFVEQ